MALQERRLGLPIHCVLIFPTGMPGIGSSKNCCDASPRRTRAAIFNIALAGGRFQTIWPIPRAIGRRVRLQKKEGKG
ncbi:hypothetical protein J8I26_15165 [Herbaspirillum sp. LeCh32-8]|uniref:hypothetical protein n=1 Tax=Herbaspirillum sp. LeCh32-8 TaxID=2821356 RepID=UPI001AEB33B3|nr:hypothetical protein [Herbaspirillum sp. LeCh32-8]MBP0599456.1 hypothetical protein [Herbaspirillum sp. LeCh32-8]